MQKYTYICWIHTDAMNNRRTQDKDAGRLLYKNIFLSLYCKGSKRVTQSLHVRGSWRPNINCNILTPKLWPSASCLSRSPGLLNRSPGVHSAGCWLSLLHFVYLRLYLYSPVFLLFNSSAFYYLQTPTQWYGHASTPPQFLPISGDRDVPLPLSLEWPVWSSLSGNNCHAVQRSLSSGASVYEHIMGFFFYLVPFHQPISAHAISSHNCH